MNKKQFMSGAPFVVKNIPGFDWAYTEHQFGGEVRISNGTTVVVVEIEEITEHWFVVECWLNKHTDGRIFFNLCELK